jgi:hypothetical protein
MVFCSKCGEKIESQVAFCGTCGNELTENRSISSVVETPSEQEIKPSEATKIFIGQKHEYYLKKWAIAENKKGKQSWNWAAFFLGFLWMTYRKMYAYAFIFIGLLALETIIEYVFDLPGSFTNAVTIAIAVTFGFQGNSWYKLHTDKKVNEVTAMNNPKQAQFQLSKQGGTNIFSPIGFLVLFIAVIGGIVFVAEGRM